MSEQKKHVGVYGVILRDQKLLLIKKSRGPYKGKLDLPGGKLEHGEDQLSGLAREIKEETGLIAKDFVLFDNYSFRVNFIDLDKEIDMHHIGMIYECKVLNIEELKKDMDEEDSLGGEWYDIRHIDTNNLSPFAAQVQCKLIQNNE